MLQKDHANRIVSGGSDVNKARTLKAKAKAKAKAIPKCKWLR